MQTWCSCSFRFAPHPREGWFENPALGDEGSQLPTSIGGNQAWQNPRREKSCSRRQEVSDNGCPNVVTENGVRPLSFFFALQLMARGVGVLQTELHTQARLESTMNSVLYKSTMFVLVQMGDESTRRGAALIVQKKTRGRGRLLTVQRVGGAVDVA